MTAEVSLNDPGADRFCADCRHCAVAAAVYSCRHPSLIRIDLVTGLRTTYSSLCYEERATGDCGLGGMNWEARDQ